MPQPNLELFRHVVDNSPNAVMVVNSTTRQIIYHNHAAETLFGEDIRGLTEREVYHRNLLSPKADLEINITTDEGTKFGALSIRSMSWHRRQSDYRIIYVRDITDRKDLETQSYIDELTGIPRRKLFTNRIREAIALAKTNQGIFGFLYIDLDGFKPINDTYGHAVGDTVLKIVTKRIKGCIREDDTIGRLGGDEFGVILLNIKKPKSAGLVARKIIDSLEREIYIDPEKTCFISASIGISIFPHDSTDEIAIIQNADRAMYVVKQDRGKSDYAFYSNGICDQFQKEQKIKTGLRRALKNGNEIILRFMPQIDLETGLLSAVEALTYWQPPNEALMPPSDFIPIAEHSGLIINIEQFVFKEACKYGMQWWRRSPNIPPFRISINLSSVHFTAKVFMETINHLLEHIGLHPSLLDLEITESTMIQDPKAMELLYQLKKKQVSITIDNYGSQTTSMLSLKRFPVTSVKLDREFVRHILVSPTDEAIVKSAINLAKELGLRIVAQGVETQEQLSVLKAWGCDEAQGYLIGKPLSAEDYSIFLDNYRPQNLIPEVERIAAPNSHTEKERSHKKHPHKK